MNGASVPYTSTRSTPARGPRLPDDEGRLRGLMRVMAVGCCCRTSTGEWFGARGASPKGDRAAFQASRLCPSTAECPKQALRLVRQGTTALARPSLREEIQGPSPMKAFRARSNPLLLSHDASGVTWPAWRAFK
jgi:hypothetical protein